MTHLRNSTLLPGSEPDTKFFDLSNVTYKASDTTVALFNSYRQVEKDAKGKFVWIAYSFEGTGVWAKKQYR